MGQLLFVRAPSPLTVPPGHQAVDSGDEPLPVQRSVVGTYQKGLHMQKSGIGETGHTGSQSGEQATVL